MSEMSELADLVEWVDHYLDENVPELFKQQPLAVDFARVGKIQEEAGEAMEVLIGITGQNPRKGVYSTPDHLYNELSDVALTAVLAIQHFTKDKELTIRFLMKKMRSCKERLASNRISP